MISLLTAPLGPLTAGVLLDVASPRATIAVFAAVALVLAVWVALSPAMRGAPSLDERTAPGAGGSGEDARLSAFPRHERPDPAPDRRSAGVNLVLLTSD